VGGTQAVWKWKKKPNLKSNIWSMVYEVVCVRIRVFSILCFTADQHEMRWDQNEIFIHRKCDGGVSKAFDKAENIFRFA
jgi:hypothetical protein